MRTANSVTTAAPRSRAECAASDNMPRLPVTSPTTVFMVTKNSAARTEVNATSCFSLFFGIIMQMV